MTTIAIAGLGAAAKQIHLPAYAKLPELKVVGGFDPAAAGTEFPFPLFRSVEEMLERTRPDILAVAAPTPHHHALVHRGLEAGCHVLCEKPFMNSLPEADDIVALARRLGRWVVVNNQYRFMNIHQAAKRSIGTPEFGDLLFVSVNQTFFTSEATESGWRGADKQRTCKEFGIHALDLCRFFFGEDPISINARMPKGRHRDSPDYLDLIQLEFSGDRVAHILLDRLSRGPHRYLDMRLDGSAGIVQTSLGGKLEANLGLRAKTKKPFFDWDISLGGHARLYHGEQFRKIASDPLDLFAHATSQLLRQFLAALRDGTPPPCHAEDNRRTLALVYAAYESAEANRPVAMHY